MKSAALIFAALFGAESYKQEIKDMEWEVGIIAWIQSNLGGVSSVLGKVFSFIGGETGLLLLLLAVMFCWKKEVGKRLAVIILAVNVWLPMIKSAVMRLRPYMEYPDRVKTLALADTSAAADDLAAQGYSFPSMHSASVPAAYFTLAREAKKKWLWILAAALTVLVGIFRVAVGMHYPTDVLAGWALGGVVLGIFALLERCVRQEWLRRLIVLIVALPGLLFVRTDDYFTSLGLLVGVIAAIPFEEKFVNYQDTRNVWAMIVRTVCAFAIYFVLNTLLKLPFSKAFLDGGSFGALLIRSARYAVIIFVIMGVYPKLFPLFEKIGKRSMKKAES